MKQNIKLITLNAMIACIYAVATILIAPIAYSEVQMRLSEIMVFLAFYNKKYIPGLIIGCFIANMPSPLGILDMGFGTLSTVIVCIVMYFLHNRYIAGVMGGVITGIIIGFELHLAYQIPFLINAFYVFIGEAIVLLIGAFLFGMIEKNKTLLDKYLLDI